MKKCSTLFAPLRQGREPHTAAIFLDLDGVILPNIPTLRCFSENLTALQHYYAEQDKRYAAIDPLYLGAAHYDWQQSAIDLVTDLCVRHQAHIVVSSNWRLQRDFEELKRLFAVRNFHHFVKGATPVIHEQRRGAEIAAYLEANPQIREFVVLDDNAFDIPEYFSEQFVQCGDLFGEAEYERALGVLGGVCRRLV